MVNPTRLRQGSDRLSKGCTRGVRSRLSTALARNVGTEERSCQAEVLDTTSVAYVVELSSSKPRGITMPDKPIPTYRAYSRSGIDMSTRMQARILLLICTTCLSCLAHADECPDIEAGLTAARLSITEFQNNDRTPAGADCAYGLATNHSIDPTAISSSVVSFYKAASDIQRVAADKRKAEGDAEDTNKYLRQEITIRQKILKAALRVASKIPGKGELRPTIVEHLSALASALALQSKYKQLADELGNRDSDIIDDEALEVWLRAVWSCAKWDGNKTNVCSPENRKECREKIEVFLGAADDMKTRNFGRQTKLDIEQLRRLKSKNGCFSQPEQL